MKAQKILLNTLLTLGIFSCAMTKKFEFKKTVHATPSNSVCSYMLVGNIGGTRARFALAELKNDSFKLLFFLDGDSRKITNFADTTNQILEEIKKEHGITVQSSCFAAAGKVSQKHDSCKITNLPYTINTNELIEKTPLQTAVVLNDFEAIGYGIEALKSQDVQCIHTGEKVTGNLTKAIIGAGTGLGESLLIWNPELQQSQVVSTEGGHVDFPVLNPEEFELINFIKNEIGKKNIVEWEHLLSGRGIRYINTFQEQKNPSIYAAEIKQNNYDLKTITQYKKVDHCCKKTVAMFAQFYGRYTKNIVLSALPLGGIYIAGGIAKDNLDLFEENLFLEEFYNNQIFHDLLKKIPVYVITNPHVELLGAILFGQRFNS